MGLMHGPQPASALLGSSSGAHGLYQPQYPDSRHLEFLVIICTAERGCIPQG